MQIKQSIGGRTIQVYRSVYVPEKKRSKQLLLLTFPSHCTDIPESALEKVKPDRTLTNDELKEVQAWLDKREVDREESILKYSVTDLPLSIDQATKGLTKYGITKEQAHTIYDRIDTLAKAIRKAGFTRLKKKPVQQPPESTQKKKAVFKKTVTKKVGKTQKKTVKKAGKKKNQKGIIKKVSKKKVKKSTGKKRKN